MFALSSPQCPRPGTAHKSAGPHTGPGVSGCGEEGQTDTMLGGPNFSCLVPTFSRLLLPTLAVPGVLTPTPLQRPLPHRRVVDLTGGVRVE